MLELIVWIIFFIIFSIIFFILIFSFIDFLCLINYYIFNYIFKILESICKNLFWIVFKRCIINIINILFLTWFIDINFIKEIIYNNINVKSSAYTNEEELDEVALKHRRKCQAIEERLKQIEKENKYAAIAGILVIIVLIVIGNNY